MLPMTPRTPSPPSNMKVENVMFWGGGGGGSAKGTGQLHCIRWTGPCTIRARALKPVRALKSGRGWVF